MKQFKGIPENIEAPILGLVTRNHLSLSRGNSVLITEEASFLLKGFAGLITKDLGKKKSSLPQTKVSGEVLNKLEEGDCVLMKWYSYGGHLEKSVIETKLLEVRYDNKEEELFEAI